MERARPTLRCLVDDLKLPIPPADEPLDEIDHSLLGKASEQFADSDTPHERIRAVDDQVLFKVKVQRWRGAVWTEETLPWLVAAGWRESGSADDFYAIAWKPACGSSAIWRDSSRTWYATRYAMAANMLPSWTPSPSAFRFVWTRPPQPNSLTSTNGFDHEWAQRRRSVLNRASEQALCGQAQSAMGRHHRSSGEDVMVGPLDLVQDRAVDPERRADTGS